MEISPGRFPGVTGSPGQTVAVHRHHGHHIVLHLEQAARMDGAALVFGHGKNRTGNHFPQLSLGHLYATAALHVRQLRVILGIGGGKGEAGEPRFNGNLEILVHGDGHGPLRQTADDIEKQPGRHNAGAGLPDIRVHGHGNGGFQVVAGQLQTVDSGPAENTLDGGQGAFRGHGAAGYGDGRNQGTFFTGKSHRARSFAIKSPSIYKQEG